jgi:hypothetical protein
MVRGEIILDKNQIPRLAGEAGQTGVNEKY